MQPKLDMYDAVEPGAFTLWTRPDARSPWRPIAFSDVEAELTPRASGEHVVLPRGRHPLHRKETTWNEATLTLTMESVPDVGDEVRALLRREEKLFTESDLPKRVTLKLAGLMAATSSRNFAETMRVLQIAFRMGRAAGKQDALFETAKTRKSR